MHLTKLEMNNYCQFDSMKVAILPGLGILTAKNGGGKSNLLNAIFFALTGESSIEGKTKAKMLRWGVKKGQVVLDFEHDGVNFRVWRDLQSSSAKIGSSKGLELNSVGEVNDFLRNLTGATPDILLLSSFMPQKGAFKLLFGTDMERMKEYSRLFRLSHLEKVRDQLQRRISLIPSYPDCTAEVKDIEARLPALKESQQKASAKVLALRKELSDLDAKLDKAAGMTKKEKEQKLAELGLSLKKTEADLEKAERSFSGLATEAAISPDDLENYSRWQRTEVVRSLLAQSRQRMTKLSSQGQEKIISESQLDELRTGVILFKARRKAFESGKCPVCMSVGLDKDAELIRDTEENLKDMSEALSVALAGNQEQERFRKELEVETKSAMELEKELKQISDMLENVHFVLADYEKKKTDAQKYQNQSNLRESFRDQIRTDQLAISEINKQISETKKIKAIEEEGISELRQRRESLRNQEFPQASAEETRLTMEIGNLSFQAVEKGKLSMKRQVREQQRKLLAEVRDVLHVEKFPKTLMCECRQLLTVLVNKHLSKFRQPFCVDIRDNLATMCIFPDNDSVDSFDLSGGQQMILTVAMRLAIAEMLGSRVALVVMDEPTNHLDEDSKANLVELFGEVKTGLRNSGVQMLVSSHDAIMQSVADYQIVLGAA